MMFISSEKDIQGISDENSSCLYSIGDDNELNLFSETDGVSPDAWEKTTLSDGIAALYKNEKITIKRFCAKKINDKFHVVAIASHDNTDELFISCTSDPTKPEWEKIPFDDKSVQMCGISNIFSCSHQKNFVTIADIYLSNGYIDRYFVDYDNSAKIDKKWIPHTFPENFKATSISCMGRACRFPLDPDIDLPGIYTLGYQNGSVQEVIYTPIYNIFDPQTPPRSASINIPSKIDAMTTQTTEGDYTNLFMCGEGKLYICPYNNQKDGSTPILIIENDLFKNVKNLYAYRIENEKKVIVWAHNENGLVFYCKCAEDVTDHPEEWSEPLVQQEDAVYFYPYHNDLTNYNSSIAFRNNKQIEVRTQSPVTSSWRINNVNLPSSRKAEKIHAYMTKITVTDENGNILPNKEVWLESVDYYNVYINNIFHSLKKEPVKVTTDLNGVIKIVYQTDSISSNEFYIYEELENAEKTKITAWDPVSDRILALDSEEKIRNARIDYGNGKTEPLVANDTSPEALKAVAACMSKISDAKKLFLHPEQANKNDRTEFKGVYVSINNRKWSYCTDKEAFIKAAECNMIQGLKVNPDGSIQYDPISSYKNDVFYDLISDVVNFAKNIDDKIEEFLILLVKETYEFIVKIGGKTFKFIIDCADAVAGGIEILWNAIKVSIEKVINFVKFVFNVNDIKKTADVIKHLVNLQLDNFESTIDHIKYDVDEFTKKITDSINQWSNIKTIDGLDNKSINDTRNSNPEINNNSVHSSYLVDYFSDNVARSDITKKQYNIENSSYNESEIEKFINDEKEILEKLYGIIEKECIEDITEIDFITLTKKFVAIILDTIIYTIKNGIDLVLNLVKKYIEVFKNILNTPIYIPVLSNILEEWFNIKQFSLLDIISFIAAVSSNTLYKIITQNELLSEAEYKKIMAMNSNKSLASVFSENRSTKEAIYSITHCAGGAIRLVECVVYPLAPAQENSKSSITKNNANLNINIALVSIALAATSIILDMIGDTAYTPYEQSDMTLFLPIYKLSTLAIIGIGVYDNDKSVETFGKFSAIGMDCFDFGNNMYNIYLTSSARKDREEKIIGIKQLVGYSLGDIGDVLEQLATFIKNPEIQPYVKVARESCVGAASCIDICVGAS